MTEYQKPFILYKNFEKYKIIYGSLFALSFLIKSRPIGSFGRSDFRIDESVCRYANVTLLFIKFYFLKFKFPIFLFSVISKLIIATNYFESVDAEWLEVYVKESSIIRDNYFGNTSQIAFKGKFISNPKHYIHI